MENNLKKITIPQLKAELQRRGLPTSGTKKDLIDRLDHNDPNRGWIDRIVRAETVEIAQDIVPDEGEASGVSGGNRSDTEDDMTRLAHGSSNRAGNVERRSSAFHQGANDPDVNELARRYRNMQLEVEFERRENACLRRELDIARREKEELQRTRRL
ncbi:uncharacterized protein LOC105279012 [Ooceraea biroi]|uniref:uncharacterized protein LOC105279012 n=1 Tax=Ooceraea biroi TaxID=2015173 RepID=UPI0005BC99B6|nr:uncharacterized protein LOC105279012 [Ooceraea biroi]